MSKTPLANPDTIKRAVQELLRDGAASYGELSNLSGRSRQVIRLWANQLDVETARERHLAKAWQDAIRANE